MLKEEFLKKFASEFSKIVQKMKTNSRCKGV
jgi:hypothetical protein